MGGFSECQKSRQPSKRRVLKHLRQCTNQHLSLRASSQTGVAISRQKACCARRFDLLRNSPSTVSTYADECELLALPAFKTSASLSKNLFFDRLRSLPDGRLLSLVVDGGRPMAAPTRGTRACAGTGGRPMAAPTRGNGSPRRFVPWNDREVVLSIFASDGCRTPRCAPRSPGGCARCCRGWSCAPRR